MINLCLILTFKEALKLHSLQVNVRTKLLCHYGPTKDKFSLGVVSISLMDSTEILIGAGDGTVALVGGDNFKKLRYVLYEVFFTKLFCL